MVSTYEYTTLENIENIAGIDFSAVDAVAFSDTRVEATITSAEKLINGYLGETLDQADTDGLETATVYITLKLLKSKLINLGYQDVVAQMDELNMNIPEILKMFLDETTDSFVDSIPMTGANYRKPDLRF